MAGGIQYGVVATSPQSAAAEKKHNIIVEQVARNFPRVELKKRISIVDICKMNDPDYEPEYSFRKSGESQVWNADGGFIHIDGKLAGVAECKYQKNRENACERGSRYKLIDCLPASGMFITCSGPGFEKMDGGGSTGPFIDIARSAGATVLVNPTHEEEKKGFTAFLLRLLENA